MRYYFVPLIIFLCFVNSLNARRTVVTTATAVNSGSWTAGDTIVLKNGTWTNQTISLRAFGASGNPVVLEAETPGEVIFNGSSRVSVSGQYIEISGIYFKDGTLSGSPVVEFRTSSSNTAENCRLTNCAIVNYNPPLNTTDSKWVSLYGKNNRVDNCSFENKNNSGTLLVVWLTAGIIPAHIIENNYFSYRNPNLDNEGNELNGQEIIRIGDSNTSMQYANCIVRHNLFEKCNGEIEIISNKSCGNLYSNNVFSECKGMLTLRHGNDCTVEGNYFFGNGISNTGGVRIIGEDHKVYNNYFQDLRGTNFRAGLCIVRGMLNSVLNDYFQVKNAQIMFNTFVNCAQAFCVNYNSSTTYTMPPIGTVIAHNNVYNTTSANTNVLIAQSSPNMDVAWKNNLMNQGKYTNFSYTAGQVVTGINPLMQQVATPFSILEPAQNSPFTNYMTGDFPLVTEDIRGRVRTPNAKIPGASQSQGATQRVMPQKSDVGATFFNGTTAVKKLNFEQFPLSLFPHEGNLTVKSTESGNLAVLDTLGRTLETVQIFADMPYQTQIGKGFFLLRFFSENGEMYSQKILN